MTRAELTTTLHSGTDLAIVPPTGASLAFRESPAFGDPSPLGIKSRRAPAAGDTSPLVINFNIQKYIVSRSPFHRGKSIATVPPNDAALAVG